jgi:fluoride exporter
MTRFLLVCAGGALGSGARYLMTLWMIRAAGAAFPWGTILVNVIGCFLIALIMEGWPALNPDVRLLLTTGMLGGFTTYSAFNQETLLYAREGAWTTALANVALTVILCFAAGILGMFSGSHLAR